jgi:multidrug resistance efflux pump
MESLTPIPTPASQRWREFRIQALPVITFISVIACIAVLWHRYVFPSNIVAQVEVTSANIITTEPAVIETLHVERFQHVKKGDPIATVSIGNSNLLTAELAGIRADLGVMRSRVAVDSLRAEQAYERERLSYVQEKVVLETDKERLALANVKLKRAALMLNIESAMMTNSSLIATQEYEIALYEMRTLDVKVKETAKYLADMEKTLPKLQYESTNGMAAIEESIRAQQAVVMAGATNITLLSPIDGVVTVISNRPGERVLPGSPIVSISGLQADRIIAYMRQPIGTVPKAGDTLQVRRRTFKRQTATATIRDVGTQLEPITAALMATSTGTLDLGLPFAINMPPNLNLLPGEVVDVIYDQKR